MIDEIRTHGFSTEEVFSGVVGLVGFSWGAVLGAMNGLGPHSVAFLGTGAVVLAIAVAGSRLNAAEEVFT